MAHLVGVSSGIFSAIPQEQKHEYAGLSKKAQYCITKGVQFVQIDLESISEFGEPDLKENMKKIQDMGIRFGIHSETRAFGVEVAELDSAIETDYKFGHQRLYDVIRKSAGIDAEYVLIHSSESQPFLFLERHMQPASLVDYYGKSFKDFLNQNENKYLMDWLMGGSIDDVAQRVYDLWIREGENVTEDQVKQTVQAQEFMWIEITGYFLSSVLKQAMDRIVEQFNIVKQQGGQLTKQQEDDLNFRLKVSLRNQIVQMQNLFLNYLESRSLRYGPERIAYYFIAKKMEDRGEKEPLWQNIIKATLDFFAKEEGVTPEEWMQARNIKRLSVEDENFRKYNFIWVPAISAKYIWGHLTNPDEKSFPNISKVLRENKILLVLEPPMAHRGVEEWLRLPNPIQFYYLAKEVGTDVIQIAMDFEHMLSIRLEPDKVIDALPPDGGKITRVIHAGWPSPLSPAHIPIPLGSEQHQYLYKILYKLRQKGFGKGKGDYYIIFERGGGQDPIQQSIISLKKIVEQLEKDTPPDKLPMDFFGIGTGELISEERQSRVIEEHARDPLKGLMQIPEEEHTFLSRVAIGKPGGAEKWKKEELR